MIYGNRFYAFNQPVKEAVEEEASTINVTSESLINGYDTVLALTEATNNDEIFDAYDNLLEETILNEAKDGKRAAIVKASKKAIREVLLQNGFLGCTVGGFYIGGECAKFMKGEGNTYLYLIKYNQKNTVSDYGGSYTSFKDLTREVAKWITDNKSKVVAAIREATKVQKVSVSDVKIQEGRLGVINLAVKYKI